MARRLGISPQRVRVLARSGRLGASKVGSQWVIPGDQPAVPRHDHAGRPLSAANAWALLALLSGESPGWVDPSVRSRLRRRLHDPDSLRDALAYSQPRAHIHRWRVLPRDIAKLAEDPRLVPTGLSAESRDLDVRPSGPHVDAYVDSRSIGAIRKRFSPEPGSASPNLILRVPSHHWVLERHDRAPPAVIAADLFLDEDPRVDRAARHLLARLTR